MTTGERDALILAKVRAGTVTGSELRQISHFNIHRIDRWDVAQLTHLTSADFRWLSDEKCEAKARFDDHDDFDGGDEE